jgi:SAM-dependent methyltransferase
MDVSALSFNSLLLLERVQLSWFPGWVPEEALAIALGANTAVAWFLRHKCPSLGSWLDEVTAKAPQTPPPPEQIRAAEVTVMRAIEDLLVYVVAPAVYDAQPFLKWDSEELLGVADFRGKRVIDVGAGTGRLTFTVAPLADHVFPVEPVANLRDYMRHKAEKAGVDNVFPVDGLITRIPFPDRFADVAMGGHVFGDDPEEECAELHRVTRPGGVIILCPGNNDRDDEAHQYLVEQGFSWSRFEEPEDGTKRKYWKRMI